jgi:hypothetical protein
MKMNNTMCRYARGLTKKMEQIENEVHQAMAIMDEETGHLLNYRQLLRSAKYKKQWSISSANEFGWLANGVGNRIKNPTNTIQFIRKKDIPHERRKDVTYGSFVCSVGPEKKEKNRTRFTEGGDHINYPGARLHIPVFRNLFFGFKKPLLTGFLRISFFSCIFQRNFHRNVFLEGSQEFLFFPILQEFFAGIPVGRNFCIYSGFLRNSGGFLFPPKAVWLRPVTKEGSLLSKIWNKIDIFNLSPEQDLTMVSAAPVLCWRLLA